MGTSVPLVYPSIPKKDHPHAYGDKYVIGVLYDRWAGIIPTRMGTSILFAKIKRFTQDHPHAYGDKVTW